MWQIKQRLNFFWINVIGLFAVAIFFRLLWLGNVPGLSGDEAWISSQARSLLSGHPFTLITPSNRILSPFYLILCILAGPLWPTMAAVRIPALVSGLALIGLSYILFKDIFGSRKALFASLLFAVLPIDIAYSRCGWEPSQTALCSLLIIYFTFKKKKNWLGLFLSLIAGITSHILLIFMIPMVVAPLLIEAYVQRRANGLWKDCAFYLLGTGLLLGVGIWTLNGFAGAYWNVIFSVMKSRNFPPREALFFALTVIRMFFGSTCYEEFATTPPSPLGPANDVGGSLVFVVIAFFAIKHWKLHRQWREIGFVIALLFSLLVFYVVAGPPALFPESERYGLIFISPLVLLFASGWAAFGQRIKNDGIFLAFCWALLLSFWFGYMQPFRSGSTVVSHYRTAPIEPKQQVIDWIKTEIKSHPVNETHILVDNYFSYWPVYYLGWDLPKLRIISYDTVLPVFSLKQWLDQGGFVLGIKGGSLEKRMETVVESEHLRQKYISGFGDHVLYLVWKRN